MSVPIYSIFCIDFRYDYLTTEFFDSIGYRFNYFTNTTAGASLALGYEKYCKYICNCSSNVCGTGSNLCVDPKPSCNPLNLDIEILKAGLIKNLEIALSIQPIEEIYLLNHQDCSAIKNYLACSGYPTVLGENNSLEIEINTRLLMAAKEYLETNFPNLKVTLGLVDINGYVCNYNIRYGSWELQFRGAGADPVGLWYGL